MPIRGRRGSLRESGLRRASVVEEVALLVQRVAELEEEKSSQVVKGGGALGRKPRVHSETTRSSVFLLKLFRNSLKVSLRAIVININYNKVQRRRKCKEGIYSIAHRILICAAPPPPQN